MQIFTLVPNQVVISQFALNVATIFTFTFFDTYLHLLFLARKKPPLRIPPLPVPESPLR